MKYRIFDILRTSFWIVLLSFGVPCIPSALGAGANGAAPKEKAVEAEPVFRPPGGIFSSGTQVVLESPVADAVVRFTLDGSEPTERSPVASGAFPILRTTLVKARLFRPNAPPGAAVAQTYTLADPEVMRFKGNLPVLVIDTFGAPVEHDQKKLVSVRVVDAKSGQTTLNSGGPEVRAEAWYRGKSSLRYLKRSIGFKTRSEDGKSKAVSILGFPADSDWVLYAPYPDKTLIRDVLAYEFSNQMGRYASRTRFVEVFLNENGRRMTMDNYVGVYVLEEKIKRSTSRVNVQKLGTNDNTEPNITGGYIFKKDHNATVGEVTPSEEGYPNIMGGGNSSSRYGFPTGPGGFPGDPKGFLPTVGGPRASVRREVRPSMPPQNFNPLVTDPPRSPRVQRRVVMQDGRAVVIEQPMDNRLGGQNIRSKGFISRGGWSAGAEEAFYTAGGNEFYYVEPKEDEITPAQKRWLQNYITQFEQVLDSPQFADPARGYAAYIDVDSFIDYHWIVEVTKNIDGFRFSTYYQKDRGGRIKAEPIWDWNLSFGNAEGKQGWMAEHWYWPQLDDQQYSYYRRLFEDPEFAQRYVDRWGQLRATVFSVSNVLARIDHHVAVLGQARVRNFQRWPILGRKVWPNRYVGRTYEDEITYMKDWVRRRLAWIDAQFVAPPQAVLRAADGGKRSATLLCDRGQILYTLDGSDPRRPGGQLSPQSKAFSEPVLIQPGQKLFARVFHDNRWSPPVRL